MKIGMVVPTLGFRGGLERYAFEMARTFAGWGHQMTLVHGSGRGLDAERFVEPFAHVTPESSWSPAGKVDVVFVQKATSVDEVAHFDGVPLVLAAHDHDLTCPRSHRYLPLTNEPCHRAPGGTCVAHGCALVRKREGFPIGLVDPFELRRQTRALGERAPIVACSRYVARRLLDAGVREDRVHVVHPILPSGGSARMPRPSKRRLLACGQLVRGKGFDLAIEAMALMPGDVELRIVGDGPSKVDLEKLAARIAPGRIHVVGYVAPEALDAEYDGASVVLVPSRWPEPFGMVGLEALRRGRPVVGANHGGIPEWLGDGGGRLVPPLDPRALAAACLELFDDEGAEVEALRNASRFDHATSASALLGIFDRAVAGARNGSPGSRAVAA